MMETLTVTQEVLVEQAKARFSEIFPCAGRRWSECFIQMGENLSFWFNDETGNTHMILEDRVA